MKIISCNTGYFLGYGGVASDYIRHPLRGVVGDRYEERENLEHFIDLIDDKNPEITVLQEVDTGSIRTFTESQPKYLINNLGQDFQQKSGIKYSSRIMRNLPIFGNMANTAIHRQGEVINHHLGRGAKSLVQEVSFNGLSVFSVHLSLTGSRTRRKQLKEIYCLADNRDRFVITGDFNFYRKSKELKNLRELVDGKVVSPGKTFPSHKPKRELDFTVYSNNLGVSCRTINSTFSDHRPIMIEIENFQP